MVNEQRNKTTPEEQDRQRKAVDLKIAGATYDQIAAQLGWADRSGAYYAVQAALARTTAESVAELRQIGGERLDLLWRKVMPGVLAGDLKAIESAVKIHAAWAKLWGVNAPERLAIAGRGMTQEEFEAQFGEMLPTTVDEDLRALGHDPVGDVGLIDTGNLDEDGQPWANTGDIPGVTSEGRRYVPSTRVETDSAEPLPDSAPATSAASPGPAGSRIVPASQVFAERPGWDAQVGGRAFR